MGQMNLCDVSKRDAVLDVKSCRLLKLSNNVSWAGFRPLIDSAWRPLPEARKSKAGRRLWGFKALVRHELYNLSDEQFERQARDQLLFMRLLGLGLQDRVPGATTVRQYRKQLAQAGVVDGLFGAFNDYLLVQCWLAMGGQVIDGWIVAVPEQRNDRDENAANMACQAPEGWADKPLKRRQKDVGAPWTTADDTSPCGYMNHINVDRSHKVIWRYKVTDAAVQTSHVIADLLENDNSASYVRADSAYRPAGIEEELERRSLNSRIHRKGYRNRLLSTSEHQGNKTRSKVRVRIEHVFRRQTNDIGGTLMRSIWIARANARSGLDIHMSRAVQVDRLAAACGPT